MAPKQDGKRSMIPGAAKTSKAVYGLLPFAEPLHSGIFIDHHVGDVHIILHPTQHKYHYILHASILSRASEIFKTALETRIEEPGNADMRLRRILSAPGHIARFVLKYSPTAHDFRLQRTVHCSSHISLFLCACNCVTKYHLKVT